MSKSKRPAKRGRPYLGGDKARVMVRVDDDEREAWQAVADGDAGEAHAPLGPWIRTMVRRALAWRGGVTGRRP